MTSTSRLRSAPSGFRVLHVCGAAVAALGVLDLVLAALDGSAWLRLAAVGLILAGAAVSAAAFLEGRKHRGRQESGWYQRISAVADAEGIPADVLGALLAGRRIQAVKRYRDLTGTSLKEARSVIDGLEHQAAAKHPSE